MFFCHKTTELKMVTQTDNVGVVFGENPFLKQNFMYKNNCFHGIGQTFVSLYSCINVSNDLTAVL